jgi:hypothetical protein
MASPIFDQPNPPKNLESLAQEELRAILGLYRKGSILVVAADTHPGLFEHALSKVQAGEDFIFRAINLVESKPQPKVHLVRCKSDALEIGNLRAKDKFLMGYEGTLETYLFDIIGEAFVAIGFKVVKGLPDRYHREWVI